MLTTPCRILTRFHQGLSKSLGLWLQITFDCQSNPCMNKSLRRQETHIIFGQTLTISARVRSEFTTSDRLWLVVDCQRIAHQKHCTLLVIVKKFNLKVGWKKSIFREWGAHSQMWHYFYPNLYGRAPRSPRGVKKSDFFFYI